MNRITRQIVLWTGSALIIALIVWGVLPKPIAVDTQAITRAPLSVTVVEEGKTRVIDRYVVSAPVAGYARRVELEVGDAVSAGQILLHLDPTRSPNLDPRTQAEFDEGHLPGAKCWDWFNAVPDGSWNCCRDPDELRSELAELGVHPSDEIVAYCRSGMRAAHTYVVLRHAGFQRVRLYDGSWQEWSMRREPDPAKGDDR